MGNLQGELREKVLQQQAAINNAVQDALQKAKTQLPPPITEQVWKYLFDHPGLSGHELVERMKHLTYQQVFSTLTNLYNRGMVVGTKRHGRRFYKTEPRMTKYELWPLPKEAKKVLKMETAKPAQTAAATSAAPSAVLPPAEVVQTTKPAQPTRFNIEDLTVAQARQLYLQLHQMFGDTK